MGAGEAGFGSVTGAGGLAGGEGDFRAGVSATASDPENEKSKSMLRMLKKAANYTACPKPQVKRAPKAYRHSRRAAPSRLKQTLLSRYVEDGVGPRTNFEMGRVLRVRSLSWQARDGWVKWRLGWAGVNGAFFSIVPPTLLLTFQIPRGKEIIRH